MIHLAEAEGLLKSYTKVNRSRASILDIVNKITEPPLLEEFTISLQSIQAKINVLNNNKSSVPDIIASKLLRLTVNAIVSALTGLSPRKIVQWLTPIYKI